MIDNLVVYNLPANTETNLESAIFNLKTCQRTLLVSTSELIEYNIFEKYQGVEAYSFLLEVICGLKSKMLGENEIVNQFKIAYRKYIQLPKKNKNTITILEKLFLDSKKIRVNYLSGVGRKTYSYITRKKMMKKKPDSVLIIGSGQLAVDLINQFKKKTNVVITGRNNTVVNHLVSEHRISKLEWDKLEESHNYPYIINTVGFDGTLLDKSFFEKWELNSSKLFIDLGSPSCIKTAKNNKDIIYLSDIFKEGAIHDDQKDKKIKNALDFIRILSKKRKIIFKEKEFANSIFREDFHKKK